jgi:hypothetical protein
MCILYFWPLVRPVSELMGWVRNVILIDVYLDLGNPGGVGILGGVGI